MTDQQAEEAVDPPTGGEPATPVNSAPGAAGVGDSITIENSEGQAVQAALLEIAGNVRSDNQFLEPDPGNRFAAVRLRIVNRGDQPFSDAISNGVVVVDVDDAGWNASLFDIKEPALGVVNIAPGDSRQGWVTIEMGQRPIKTVQWTTDSGFGDTAQWSVR